MGTAAGNPFPVNSIKTHFYICILAQRRDAGKTAFLFFSTFLQKQTGAKRTGIYKKRLTGHAGYAIVNKRDKILGLFFMLKKRVEVADMRTKITLACTECKQRNYNTTKDKKTHPDRMETKKYCRFCKTHTLHKETK